MWSQTCVAKRQALGKASPQGLSLVGRHRAAAIGNNTRQHEVHAPTDGRLLPQNAPKLGGAPSKPPPRSTPRAWKRTPGHREQNLDGKSCPTRGLTPSSAASHRWPRQCSRPRPAATPASPRVSEAIFARRSSVLNLATLAHTPPPQ